MIHNDSRYKAFLWMPETVPYRQMNDVIVCILTTQCLTAKPLYVCQHNNKIINDNI